MIPRYLPLLLALGAGPALAQNLVVCTEASPEGFDIVQYTGAVTADAAAETVFSRLVAFRPGSTEVVPALAQRWEVSPDGLAYTFHLRPGVKFHSLLVVSLGGNGHYEHVINNTGDSTEPAGSSTVPSTVTSFP